jgi:hypothetical protein
MLAALPLPDLPHLVSLTATLAVAACCVGLGVLAGARSLAVALSAGWGVGVLVLTLLGTLAGAALSPILAVLGVAGLTGLMLAVRRLPDEEWRACGRTLLLAAPFLLLAGAITPASFDDYSHWLPNLGHLVLHDHFPGLAEPNLVSVRPGYPYGMAFIGLAVSRLTGDLAEGAGVVWNALLLVAVGQLAASLLARRGAAPWFAAALGLLAATLASPSFVPRLFLSNYGDGPVGSVAGAMAASLILQSAAPAKGQARAMFVLGLCGAALVSIRQDAASILALVVGGAGLLAVLRGRLGLSLRLPAVALLLPAPLLVWSAWGFYQAAQIPGGVAGVLPFAQWHWAAMPACLNAMLHVALQKPGHFGLVLAEVVAAVLVLRRPGRATPLSRAAVVLGAAIGLGKIVSMAAIYLVADFDAARVAEAHEFWRFTVHVGPAVLVAGMALVPLRRMPPLRARMLSAGIGAVMLLLPVLGAQWLRPDAPRAGHVPYLWLRAAGRDIVATLPPGAALVLVDLDHHELILPEIFPLRYRLALGEPADHATRPLAITIVAGTPPVHVVVAGGLPEEPDAGLAPVARAAALREVLGAPYVWVWDGGPAASGLLGLPLPRGRSALLERGSGGLHIIRDWDLPR